MDSLELNIVICSYAYRDKRIVQTIEDAIDLCDIPERVGYSLVIQDSYHHLIKQKENLYCSEITYLPWTNTTGFSTNRFWSISKIPKNPYLLFIMPGTKFSKSWDTKLINLIKNNNNSISFENDIFSLYGTLIKKNTILDICYPEYLKKAGEEKDISIKLYCSGNKIVSGIENIITKAEPKIWDHIQFSVHHNYRQVEDLYSLGKNKYCQLPENFVEYSKLYPIKKLPFVLDDPEYSFSVPPPPKPVDRFMNRKNKI